MQTAPKGDKAIAKIDEIRAKLEQTALNIWQNPEGPYREFKACEWISSFLREEGFDVEIGAGGVPTAIRATWGSGSPVIGTLGEYDALPGLSQKVSPKKENGGHGPYGHACGHNLLGVVSLGGIIGLKAEMEANRLPGTIVYYGCPAEEVLTGKPFMARGGCFKELDCVVSWHPGTINQSRMGRNTAVQSAYFHFKGVTAHAGRDPHNGRSALDGAELMNMGVQFLREHVTSDVRIHYIITNGGEAPNIVPEAATNKYFVRAFTREAVEDVFRRVELIAKGAAMMTETELEVENLGGCYESLPNLAMVKACEEALLEIPQEPFTQEEFAFAKALNDTSLRVLANNRATFKLPEDMQIHEGVVPYTASVDGFSSSDTGDVQHIAPGVSFTTATYALGCPGHSWQSSALAGSSIGLKAMIYAAKVTALTGVKILSDPAILQEAKAEFQKVTAGKPYKCPITPEMQLPK